MKNKILSLLVLFFIAFIVTACGENDNRIDLSINTEGLGQVSYYIDEANKIDFDDEYPVQTAYTSFIGETKVTIDAKADEGWKFVKWLKDGKEYSKESKLVITISKDTKLIAVFENE